MSGYSDVTQQSKGDPLKRNTHGASLRAKVRAPSLISDSIGTAGVWRTQVQFPEYRREEEGGQKKGLDFWGLAKE